MWLLLTLLIATGGVVDGTSEINSYDALGNLLTETDRGGRITRHEYDLVNRNVRTLHADGTQSRRAYDRLDRLVLEIGRGGAETRYEYDQAGRRTAEIDNDGNRTEYAYNQYGALIRFTDARGHTTHYEYDEKLRPITTILPDGARLTATLDALDRKSSETNALGHQTRFAYDAVGNLVRVVDALGGVTEYSYNANDQLLEATTAGETTAYSYDANGNQIQSWSAAGLLFYDYDAENRLTGVRGEDWSMDLEMDVDVDGMRHAKTVDGVRQDFLVDPNRAFPEVIERDEGGNRETYVYAAERLTRHDGTTTTHYLADAQNSIRAAGNESGTLLNSGHYTAYGIPSDPAEFGYTGEAYDSESGLLYLRARYYDPAGPFHWHGPVFCHR